MVVTPEFVVHASVTFLCSLATSLSIGLAGCSQDSDTTIVEGKVSYGDDPLTNATLTFFPAQGRPVSTPVSEDGGYHLDLPPGQYKVVVNIGMELPPDFKEGDPPPPPKSILPPHYTRRAKTILTATVTEGHREPINFELK